METGIIIGIIGIIITIIGIVISMIYSSKKKTYKNVLNFKDNKDSKIFVRDIHINDEKSKQDE